MRHRVIVTFAALFAAVLAGVAIGSRSPIAAQDSPPPMGITPVPGRHSEVQALFSFCVWETPNQQGCRQAEFKDNEYGRSYYKVDAAPGCGSWVVAPGTKPGLILEPGGTNCTGFRVDFGAIYWFTVPPIVVTLPPASPPPPATVTVGPTATPPPTVASGATITPSVPTSTPTVTPTPAPTGTPRILYGNMCSPNPTPEYPHQMVIVGIVGATAPDYVWWCIPPNATPDLVIAVPMATYQASYDNGPRQLLKSLGR